MRWLLFGLESICVSFNARLAFRTDNAPYPIDMRCDNRFLLHRTSPAIGIRFRCTSWRVDVLSSSLLIPSKRLANLFQKLANGYALPDGPDSQNAADSIRVYSNRYARIPLHAVHGLLFLVHVYSYIKIPGQHVSDRPRNVLVWPYCIDVDSI